eukprot:SAG31_NODE_932_length_10913_cov_3.933235_1_plen_107_part_00
MLPLAHSNHMYAPFYPQAEFYVLKDVDPSSNALGVPFEPLHTERPNLTKPAYDVARVMDNMGWLGELVDHMNDLGWQVYSFDHEDGVGQFEIDCAFKHLNMALSEH